MAARCRRSGWRGLVAAAVVLQLFFVLRIALMAWWNPASTSFERSQLWQHWHPTANTLTWRQQWVDYDQIATTVKQAVLTAEDDAFTEHSGVQWQAIEKAWQRNQKAQAQAANRPARASRSMAALPSPSSWPRICCCRGSATCCARARSWS